MVNFYTCTSIKVFSQPATSAPQLKPQLQTPSSPMGDAAGQPKQNTSVWLALNNRVFLWLWLASVVSGVCVSAHDPAATWLMGAWGGSPLLLSLMATAASLPFFLF